MPLRPCLGTLDRPCGKPTQGSRCPTCKTIVDNQRYTARGTTAQRGLAGEHARMSRHYKQINAACVHCGQHGTPDNPITAGHITPRSKGGTNTPDNYQPECRRCNSSKQDRHESP